MKLEIGKNTTLAEIETGIGLLTSNKDNLVEVWLARNMGRSLFIESRIGALMATAVQHKRLEVIDWIDDDLNWINHFTATLSGVSAIAYAHSLRNAKAQDFTKELSKARQIVEQQDGLAHSPEPARAITYCAFDIATRRLPLALAAITNKQQFRTEFIRRLSTAFSISALHPDLFRADYERDLAEFVYEIYQNGLQHGCRDSSNGIIPGLRTLHVRRHIANSVDELLRRGQGFPELQEYLETFNGTAGAIKLFEISISDQGLGITDRFLASRPDYASTSLGNLSSVALVNAIVHQALSSKLHQPGAGHGLRKTLEAVHELRGFLSVRFGREWLVSTSNALNAASRHELRQVTSSEQLGRVAGTHFNILLQAL